jgi:hypothetical protein
MTCVVYKESHQAGSQEWNTGYNNLTQQDARVNLGSEILTGINRIHLAHDGIHPQNIKNIK